MKNLIFLGLLLAIQLARTQETCSNLYNNCKQCTQDPGCGWCAAIGQCLNGTANGPAGGANCFGKNWQTSIDSCPDCTSFGDCESCLYYAGDCAWCEGTQKCAEWGTGTIGACNPTTNCPCNTYDDCSDCNQQSQCVWCGGNNNTCINTNDVASCPLIAHTCPCTLNKDCHSCREDHQQGCRWCPGKGANGSPICLNSNDANAEGCPTALTCDSYCQASGKTCKECNQLNGCVWCGDTETCADASYATCLIRHTCPNCAAHRYCDPCIDEGDGDDCVWCESGECRERANPGNCLIAHTCQAYCTKISGCANCNAVPGCGWCEQTSSCVDADASSCLLVHGCTDNEQKCGFDGGAFVGGMFLGIGLVAIGIGGFLFYRWKVGGRAAYSELR